MEFLEKDLEQIIYETPDEKLEQKNLYTRGRRFRQLRIGNYGIADMITVQRYKTDPMYESQRTYNCLEITVYELKKDKIGISAFLQAVRYVKGISKYLENRHSGLFLSYRIVLIGRTIDDSGSFLYLPDVFCNPSHGCVPSGGIESVELFTYSYGVDGLNFKEHSGYQLVNQGF